MPGSRTEPAQDQAGGAAAGAAARAGQGAGRDRSVDPVAAEGVPAGRSAAVARLLAEARAASGLADLETAEPEPDLSVREYVGRLAELAENVAAGRPWDRMTQVQRLGAVWVPDA